MCICELYILLLLLFIIVRIVDAFHKGFSIVNLVCQRIFEQMLDFGAVCHAACHGCQVVLFVHFAPVDALLQMLL